MSLAVYFFVGAKSNKKVENQMSSSLHEVTLAMRFTTVTQKEKEQKESEFFLFSDIILEGFSTYDEQASVR